MYKKEARAGLDNHLFLPEFLLDTILSLGKVITKMKARIGLLTTEKLVL